MGAHLVDVDLLKRDIRQAAGWEAVSSIQTGEVRHPERLIVEGVSENMSAIIKGIREQGDIIPVYIYPDNVQVIRTVWQERCATGKHSNFSCVASRWSDSEVAQWLAETVLRITGPHKDVDWQMVSHSGAKKFLIELIGELDSYDPDKAEFDEIDGRESYRKAN
jgi:hypothetical protein